VRPQGGTPGPAFAEPWFLYFNADVEIRVAMTPEDLQKAGLEKLEQKLF
jgi:hypothetical protein